jgi:glycosyltransferase involved in cell wall biosynthesis
MLDDITPVLLTYNEEANIGRSLDRLGWADKVVVVDSFSTDNTVAIASSRSNVRLFQHAFESHSQQWNFAIQNTEIKTDWILALDADFILTDEFVEELIQFKPSRDINGYFSAFVYCIWGRQLRAAIYPPVRVLFRNGKAHYVQDGHTQRVQIEGKKGRLQSKILHDDRKSLSRWLQAQDRYMQLEAKHISLTKWSDLGAADKVRKLLPLLTPFLVFSYCYFGKWLWLDGRPGLYYSLQRMLAESMLGLRLIEDSWCALSTASSEQHRS